MGFADHFSGAAAQYAAFRPDYPEPLVAWLARLAAGREVVWDCATGNGQAARLLANHFDRVVATDASATQLAHAGRHARVSYVRALAEAPGFAAGSFDLVAVAQALHWFDRPRFYREAARVLRPRGVLAAWCYDNATVDAAVDPIFVDFYERRVGRYWPPERRHIEAHYRDLDFPFEEVATGEWNIVRELTRAQFLGYVATWSAVTRAREAEHADPVPELERALAPVWPERELRKVCWPIGLRVGRRPD